MKKEMGQVRHSSLSSNLLPPRCIMMWIMFYTRITGIHPSTHATCVLPEECMESVLRRPYPRVCLKKAFFWRRAQARGRGDLVSVWKSKEVRSTSLLGKIRSLFICCQLSSLLWSKSWGNLRFWDGGRVAYLIIRWSLATTMVWGGRIVWINSIPTRETRRYALSSPTSAQSKTSMCISSRK